MFTGDNNRFLRLWFEMPFGQFGLAYKPYSKGGQFRRWYGNNGYVVRWQDDGREIREYSGSGNINLLDYFKPCIVWSLITSGFISFRILDSKEFVIGDAGPACYTADENRTFILGLLNSSVTGYFSKILNPTLNWPAGIVGSFPIASDLKSTSIDSIVVECVLLSRHDYDSFETSWDFKRHPLV